jgi:hypothetical protein
MVARWQGRPAEDPRSRYADFDLSGAVY